MTILPSLPGGSTFPHGKVSNSTDGVTLRKGGLHLWCLNHGPVLNDEDLAGTNAVVKQGICKSQAGVEEVFFLMVCQKKKTGAKWVEMLPLDERCLDIRVLLSGHLEAGSSHSGYCQPNGHWMLRPLLQTLPTYLWNLGAEGWMDRL